MMMRPHTIASLPACLLAVLSLAPPPQAPSTSQATSANTWVGRYREVEEYLRTAECDGMETLGHPASGLKRCVLRPGGPVSRMAWKPLLPGVYRGFRESYKADIAAYELDKLLKMDMVPPVVERELQGHKGSATFWVENIVVATSESPPGAAHRAHWESQLSGMKMFDNLIGNKNRNVNNILRDAAWNMILLDHSRAFGTDTELLHSLTRVERDYWARIEKLTRKELDATLRPWLDEAEIPAILDRREKMKAVINRRAGDAGFVQ